MLLRPIACSRAIAVSEPLLVATEDKVAIAMTPAIEFFTSATAMCTRAAPVNHTEMYARSDDLVSIVRNEERRVRGCLWRVKADKISAERPTVVGGGGVAGCFRG